MEWKVTYSGTSYYFRTPPESGNRTPTWIRKPRATITPHAGTGAITYHRVGYEPYRIEIPAYIKSDTQYNGLAGFEGVQVTVTDGTTTWTATMETFDVHKLMNGCEGYEGRITFVRGA